MQVLKINKDAARKLLASDETFAFTLMTILLSYYGQDTFDENPVVLFKNLEEDFHITLPEESENRINAALTAMTTDLFYTQWDAFKTITIALNEGDIGDVEDEDDADDLSAPEILWSITEVGLLTGENFAGAESLLSDAVAAKCNEVVESEAEDSEVVEPETDTMEEAFVEPYYQKYVTANLMALARQLLSLGVPEGQVAELLAAHRRSIEELKAEQV
jgi:hypothetical protein